MTNQRQIKKKSPRNYPISARNIKDLKKTPLSSFALTPNEKARAERIRVAEEQAKKVNYELGGPVTKFLGVK